MRISFVINTNVVGKGRKLDCSFIFYCDLSGTFLLIYVVNIILWI